MPLTVQELAGFGSPPPIPKGRLRAPGNTPPPSTEEAAKYSQLRPSVSSLEVASAENEWRAALLVRQRAGETSRRCAEYIRTNRNPEDYGYSTGCGLESSAATAASRRAEEAKRRLEELRELMSEQRRASYEVDLVEHPRSAAILYRDGVPFRAGAPGPAATPMQPPALAPARPAPRRGALPWVLGGAALAAIAFILVRRT